MQLHSSKSDKLHEEQGEDIYKMRTKDNAVAYILINKDDNSIGYIDTTGRFPQRSGRGHEYILVGYHYDGNAILAKAIKDRSAIIPSYFSFVLFPLSVSFCLQGSCPVQMRYLL